MKATVYRIVTILLMVALIATLAFSVFAVHKTTGTQDGLYAIFTTDKQEYTADEEVKVNLQLVNNAAGKANVNLLIQMPSCMQVSSGSASQSVTAEVGSVWDAEEVTLTYNGAADESGLAWIWWVVAGVVVIAGAVLLLIYGKNLKSHVSILLMIAMMLSFVTMAMPVSAEGEQKSFDIVNKIIVDGREVELTATISYTIDAANLNEEIDDGRLVAFYFNDFEDPDRWIMDGAKLSYNENLIDETAEENGNHYGYIQSANTLRTAYFQANLKNPRIVDHMVFRIDLSTSGKVPQGTYLSYRYTPSLQYTLFQINEDGHLTIAGQDFPNVVIEKGKWLQLEFVIDFTPEGKDVAAVYVNDKKLADVDLPDREANYNPTYMRLYMRKQKEVGNNLWFDNFAVYESDVRLSLDQIKSPKIPTGERRLPADTVDVEMIHPELSDMGKDAVAFLVGSKAAYAGEKLITMSAAAQAVTSNNAVVDIKVPGSVLKQYLGATGLDDNTLYSVKDYANNKNVLIDSRGVVIVSDKKLDATADVKLVTMVYGYLKTGNLANNYAVAPTFSQTVIDEAFITPDPTFGNYSPRTAMSVRTANVLYYLLLVARMDETAKSSDGRSVKDEAIRRMRYLIDGGNEPNCTPGCFWDQAVIGNCLVLAKHTPSIWNSFTAEEKGKFDLLMECLAITSNFGQNELNDYKTGFDFRGNYDKGYNNNFKSANYTNHFNAVLYFGSVEKVNEIYMNFSHANYLKRLEKAGFTNIIIMWTMEDMFGVSIGDYMDFGGDMYYKPNSATTKFPIGGFAGTGVGVRTPWSYIGASKIVFGSDDFYPAIFDWFKEIYAWQVISSYNIPGEMTYAYISTGVQSPYQGQAGMLRELAGDSEGRSKCDYSILSAMVINGLLANLKLLGKWDSSTQTPEIGKMMRILDSRINVGNRDLFFKLEQGYYGNSQKTSTYEDMKSGYIRGIDVIQDIWYNFQSMDNHLVEVVRPDTIVHMEPAAEPMNGITKAPEGAVIAMNRSQLGGFIDPRMEYIIDGKCYYEGVLEYDLVIGKSETTEFSGVIAMGAATKRDSQYGDYGMLFSLNDGDILAYNGDTGDYVATGARFGHNYRFHVKIDFDCKAKCYDVTLTQTWPKTDTPRVYTVKDLWFRNGDFYVSCVVPCNAGNTQRFWLENVEISGKTRVESPYNPYAELNVSIDWSDVPVSQRPSTLKAYVVFDGNKHPHKYVTLTAADGWKMKSFDHLPTEFGLKPVEYSIYVEPQTKFAAIISEKDKNNTIKITASTKPVIYDNDFQSGELGILTDATSGGKSYIATEGSNKFLALDNKEKLKHQLSLTVDGMLKEGKLNSLFSIVFFEMDLRKFSKDSLVSGYALGYRKDKVNGEEGTDPHYLINVVNNVLQVKTASKTYKIGELTDDWQTLKVCYDVANNRALVSYGSETNFVLAENLPANRSSTFYVNTKAGYHGLAIDNMKVYCDNTKSVDSVLDTMTTNLKVNMSWGSDVAAKDIPASVKVYLVANGKVTDKYVTLKKSENWKAKTFKDLKVMVDGEKQEYSLKPEYLYNVHTYTEQVGTEATIAFCSKYTYYDNDFSNSKVEVTDKKAQVLDKNGNVLNFNNAETAIAGSNPYVVFNGVTATIRDNAMNDARNVILKLRLKSDKFVADGNFMASYVIGTKDGSSVYANLIEVENTKGVVSCEVLGKRLCFMNEGEWIDLEIRMDFENNVCMAKLNDGDWQYIYGCPERTGSFIRFYSNKIMYWHVDDLKVYTDATWSTGTNEKETDVNAKVNWEGAPALDSVRVQLYCNGVAVSGKTLTLNADNNWSGVFSNLPTKDKVGTNQVYTVKALDTASGYNLYTTGNGYTINFTKMDYYYWNDFAGMSMTDANGVAPSSSPSVNYDTTDNVFAKYQGTMMLSNDAIKTAKNVMIGAKLKLDPMVAYAYINFRYKTADNDNFELFKAEADKNGESISLKLLGTKVGTMEAGKWYDFVIAYNQQKHEICLYVDGTLVGKPVAVEPNVGNYIKIYANSSASWDMDDLRVYTDPTWNWLDEIRTYEDKTVNVSWNGETPALDNLTVQLYANGTAVDGKTLTLNAGNNWTGIFEDLPSHDDHGNDLSYTIAQVETLTGYNSYLTGNGLTLNCVKETYYYWNDFAGSSMTDANGVAPSASPNVSYDTTDNVFAKYQGTLLLSNEAIRTAKNVMVGTKLKLDTKVAYAYINFRYQTADNANYELFRAEVDKNGEHINLKLLGTKVGTMEAGKWYDFVIAYNQQNQEICLYVDGTLVGEPVAVEPNVGNYIKIYANSSASWDMDDLRVYTDPTWDWLGGIRTYEDKIVNVSWDGATPALDNVTVQLYANGTAVDGKTLTLNAGNNWTGIFEDLPSHDDNGNELTYTVALVETLTGYNTYLTGNGFTINCVKDTYYYWNDFAGSSMTDANGVAPSASPSVNYDTTDNVFAKYQGTMLLSNEAIKTAKNVMIGAKLKLDPKVAYAYINFRYKTADNDNFELFRAEVDKNGEHINLKLLGTKVGTMDAGKWYDFVIAYDQQNQEICLYVDGTPVGEPVAVAPNVGNYIKIYANSYTSWDMDDLRVYTDNDWSTSVQETTDVTVNITWQDNENTLNYRPAEQVTAKLYADGEFVKDEIIYAAGGWTATIQDLPKLNSTTGNEIVYTVTVTVDNYTATYNGTDVTLMLYLPDAVVSKSVEIVWDDNENAMGHRPAEEVTVQLYADGVPTGEPVKVKLADGWKYTFENLPQFNTTTCTEIVYTAMIENVDYYIASYQGDQIVMSNFVKLTWSVVTVETPFAD